MSYVTCPRCAEPATPETTVDFRLTRTDPLVRTQLYRCSSGCVQDIQRGFKAAQKPLEFVVIDDRKFVCDPLILEGSS